MEAVTQQTAMEEQKQPIGYREVQKAFSAEELVEGYYYYNNRIPADRMIKVLKKQENKVRIEIWSSHKSCFVQTTMDYSGFYRIVTVPVYE
jgi:hypothetical protein